MEQLRCALYLAPRVTAETVSRARVIMVSSQVASVTFIGMMNGTISRVIRGVRLWDQRRDEAKLRSDR